MWERNSWWCKAAGKWPQLKAVVLSWTFRPLGQVESSSSSAVFPTDTCPQKISFLHKSLFDRQLSIFFEKISEESEQLHLELCGVHILHILHLSRWILRSLGASPEAHRVICFRPVEPEWRPKEWFLWFLWSKINAQRREKAKID